MSSREHGTEVAFERRDRPAHLYVRLRGHIALEHVEAYAEPFENELGRVQPGYVLVSDHRDLHEVEPNALGVLFYFARRIFRARPGAVILIKNGPFVAPRMRSYVSRLDDQNVLHIVASPDEASVLLHRIRAA